MPRPFYNTIQLEGQELVLAGLDNMRQELRVYLYLVVNWPDGLTAWDVYDDLLEPGGCRFKGSAGRCLTNLYQLSLIGIGLWVPGPLGKQNRLYHAMEGLNEQGSDIQNFIRRYESRRRR